MTKRLDKFTKSLTKYISKFNIKFKNESLFMKLLGHLLFFNKYFMTNFITTIGYTVYFPSRESLDEMGLSALATVAHEYRHARDAKKVSKFVFGVLYLLPQLLALIGILSIIILTPLLLAGIVAWSWWFIALFSTLFFLAPIPAYFRTKYEVAGYSMSLFMINELQKERKISKVDRAKSLEIARNNYNLNFVSSAYYYMWPFGVKKQLEKVSEDILEDRILRQNIAYQEVYKALKESLI